MKAGLLSAICVLGVVSLLSCTSVEAPSLQEDGRGVSPNGPASPMRVSSGDSAMQGTGDTVFGNDADVLFSRFERQDQGGTVWFVYTSDFVPGDFLMLRATEFSQPGTYRIDPGNDGVRAKIGGIEGRSVEGTIHIDVADGSRGSGSVRLIGEDGSAGTGDLRFLINDAAFGRGGRLVFVRATADRQVIPGEEDEWLVLESDGLPTLRFGIRISSLPHHSLLPSLTNSGPDTTPPLSLNARAADRNVFLESENLFRTWIDFDGRYDPRDERLVIGGLYNLTSGIKGGEVRLDIPMPEEVKIALGIGDPEIRTDTVVTVDLDTLGMESTPIGPVTTDWIVFSGGEGGTRLFLPTDRIPADGRYLVYGQREQAYLIVDGNTGGWVHGYAYIDRTAGEVSALAGEFTIVGDTPLSDTFYRVSYGRGAEALHQEHAAGPHYLPVEGRSGLYRLLRNPARGYYYDAYVLIPEGWEQKNRRLLVTPANTGIFDDRVRVHDEAVRRQIEAGWEGRVTQQLGSPTIFPIFPTPATQWWAYVAGLNRGTLEIDGGRLERVDRQLVQMIDDARELVQSVTGTAVRDKVLLTGFSASGMFVNRFAMMYPGIVHAYAAGGTQRIVTLPRETLNRTPLPFPIGTADLPDFTGAPFDAETWREISQFIYWGDQDTADPVESAGSFSGTEPDTIRRAYGSDLDRRWQTVIDVYTSTTPNVQFVTYAGLGHDIVVEDVVAFLRENSGDEFTPIRPRRNAQIFLGE